MTTLLADATWTKQAACRGHDPELWWAIPGSTEDLQAQRICLTQCPVRDQCLEYALYTGQEYGRWGGLDERQRRQAARDRFQRQVAVEASRLVDSHGAMEVLQELADRGVSPSIIATQFGVQTATVRRWLANIGSRP